MKKLVFISVITSYEINKSVTIFNFFFLNIGDFWEGSIWAVNEVAGSRSIKVLETWIQGEMFEVG